MITVAFPDGTMEEYDLQNESDTRAYEYKISNRVRLLKKGEQIVIRGDGQ